MPDDLKILLIGDVCGDSGVSIVVRLLPGLIDEHSIDLVVCNGENAAKGFGITEDIAERLFKVGVDCITLGNHALRQRDIFRMLGSDSRIIRPYNLPAKAPGRGLTSVKVARGAHQGVGVGVINIMGSLFLGTGMSAFDVSEDLVAELRRENQVVVVDMHAEATSEKVALGHLLDGAASVVVGTHTHVQTSDARVLPGGTAYITDLGMTGPHDSVIGVKKEIVLRRLMTGIGEKFVTAKTGVQLEGAIASVDVSTGHATAIESIRVS